MTVQRGDSAQPFAHPGYVSGDYFPPPFSRITLATGVAAATFVAYPVFVPVDTPISALGIYCSAFVASAKMMLGLYSNVAHRPGALLVAIAAELDLTAANGWKEGAVSFTLLAGQIYWLVAHTSGVAASYSCVNNAAGVMNPLLPSNQAIASNSNASVGALAAATAYVTNTLLPTAPALAPTVATNIPIPMIKVA